MSRAICLTFILSAMAWGDPVTNGSFETGDLTGWTDTGDTTSQVVATLDGGLPATPLISPTEGSFFAVIGTGPGDIGLDGLPDTGILQQTFLVGALGGTLSFDWNFITGEFTGSNASTLDFFKVTITRAGDPTLVLIVGDVSGAVAFLTGGGTVNSVLGFSFIDPVDADLYGVSAPDGSVYLEQTGWRSFSFSLAPGSFTLRFSAGDEFDGSFDSALLVDNVHNRDIVRDGVPIPEPGGLVLLSAVALTRFVARRRKRGG